MAFTNYVPPLLNREQAGALPDLIGSILSGYTDTTKSRYLQPNLEEELKKAQLYNQYYGPNIESQIGLRGAQSGLIGEQTKGARIENQYLPQFKQAQIQQLQANAEKAKLLQMIREQMMGGSQITNQGNSEIPMFSGQGMPQPQFAQGATSPIAQQQPPLDYARAATMMQALGLGKPQVVEANGKYMAITPFGSADTGVSDLTAQEKAFQSGLGKVKSQFYGNSVDAFNSLNNQELALNELKNAVENNTQFRNVVGPIRKPITYWLGSPEQQKLLGTLQTSSGEIALQVAPSLKGAFTGRDQTLINTIKASPADPADVFIGKLSAQLLINSVLKNRAKIQAELTEQGMTPIKASQLAAKQTPLENFKPLVEKLIHPAGTSNITSQEARAELERRRSRRNQ